MFSSERAPRCADATMPDVKTEDADYRHIEKSYDEGSKDNSGHFQQPHAFIEPDRQEFIRLLPSGSLVFDCSCGPGMDTERFSQFGSEVNCIDLSERFVQLTKARVPAATVQKMDMSFSRFSAGKLRRHLGFFQPSSHSTSDIHQTPSGFKRVLRPGGLFFTAVHRGTETCWVKTTISEMERDTCVQEWIQNEIEDIVTSAGLTILRSRSFVGAGGRNPLLSILAKT